MQPIPLADLPILLTLQSLMVGLIIHTTGRRVDALNHERVRLNWHGDQLESVLLESPEHAPEH